MPKRGGNSCPPERKGKKEEFSFWRIGKPLVGPPLPLGSQLGGGKEKLLSQKKGNFWARKGAKCAAVFGSQKKEKKKGGKRGSTKRGPFESVRGKGTRRHVSLPGEVFLGKGKTLRRDIQKRRRWEPQYAQERKKKNTKKGREKWEGARSAESLFVGQTGRGGSVPWENSIIALTHQLYPTPRKEGGRSKGPAGQKKGGF